MSKTTIYIISAVFLFLSGYFVLKRFFEDQIDPYWTELDKIIVANGIKDAYNSNIELSTSEFSKYRIVPIQEKYDSLRAIYSLLQEENADAISFEDIVDKPFPLVGEAGLYFSFLDKLFEAKAANSENLQNKVILQGVSGSGKTTLIDRMALIIAGNEENILRLMCVEKLEVEYNKEYIGEYTNGKFVPGKFLFLIEKCYNNPGKNFVFILDDVDKIFPSPVFGSQVWNSLDRQDEPIKIDGYRYQRLIPKNLFIISATHSEPGYTVEINAEIRRRLGSIFPLNADINTFLLYLKTRVKKDSLNSAHIKRLLYFFKTANEKISSEFDEGFTLGNWSNLRKVVKESKFEDFVNEFVINISNFHNQKAISRSSFADILYSIDNDGIVPSSSDMNKIYNKAEEIGIVSELGVSLLFALVSGIIALQVFVKRKKNAKKINHEILELTNKYKPNDEEYIRIVKRISAIKNELRVALEKGKIKSDEFILFWIMLNDVESQIHQLDLSFELLEKIENKRNEFLSNDGVIDGIEKQKLLELLKQKKRDIQPEVYLKLWEKINQHS